MAKAIELISFEKRVKAPWAIKAITLVSYLAAIVLIIAGIGLIIGGVILEEQHELLNGVFRLIISDSNSQLSNTSPYVKDIMTTIIPYSGPVLLAIGLVLILVGLFRIFVGFNFLHGKSWSRVLVICFCIIWIGFGLYSFARDSWFVNAITIIFNLVILYYLLFSNEVKHYFHHDLPQQKEPVIEKNQKNLLEFIKK